MRRIGALLALVLGSLVGVAGCDLSDDCPTGPTDLWPEWVCKHRGARERIWLKVAAEGEEPPLVHTGRLYELTLPKRTTSIVVPLLLGNMNATYFSVGPVRDARLLDENGTELVGALPAESCADADRERMFRLEWDGHRPAWLHAEFDEGTEHLRLQADDAASLYLLCE